MRLINHLKTMSKYEIIEIMKILFIIGDLESGGAEKVVSTLANAFSFENEVGVLMISTSKKEAFYKINPDVKLIPLLDDGEKLPFFTKVKRIRNVITRFNPDVVISFLNYVIIYSWLAIKKIKKKLNLKFVVSERNDPNNVPSSFVFRAIRNRIFSKADGCVFQTNDAKSYFKNVKSSTIIPNPVYLNRESVFDFEKYTRNENILFVGSNKKEKNRLMAYKAFSDFCNDFPKYKLIVVGSKPSKKEDKQIQKIGIQNKLIFVGKDNDWHQKYQSSSMFILSSDFEGMPNSLLEAAALQIPCIATNCPSGGPKDILENGKNGILIKVGDYKELALNMKKLAKSAELQNHYSRQCSNISLKYNSQKIAGEWLKYIKSLM